MQHIRVTLPTRLVIQHKSGSRKIFSSRSKTVPCVGQIVGSLQSYPKRLGAWIVFWSVDESTQLCNRAHNLIQTRAALLRDLTPQYRINTLPFTSLKDHFTVHLWAVATEMADEHDAPGNHAVKGQAIQNSVYRLKATAFDSTSRFERSEKNLDLPFTMRSFASVCMWCTKHLTSIVGYRFFIG